MILLTILASLALSVCGAGQKHGTETGEGGLFSSDNQTEVRVSNAPIPEEQHAAAVDNRGMVMLGIMIGNVLLGSVCCFKYVQLVALQIAELINDNY